MGRLDSRRGWGLLLLVVAGLAIAWAQDPQQMQDESSDETQNALQALLQQGQDGNTIGTDAANQLGGPNTQPLDDAAQDDQALQDDQDNNAGDEQAAANDQAADDQAADDQALDDEAADDQAADDQAADDQAADDQAADDQAADDQAADDQAGDDQGVMEMVPDETPDYDGLPDAEDLPDLPDMVRSRPGGPAACLAQLLAWRGCRPGPARRLAWPSSSKPGSGPSRPRDPDLAHPPASFTAPAQVELNLLEKCGSADHVSRASLTTNCAVKGEH
jgi:hypothetical protein